MATLVPRLAHSAALILLALPAQAQTPCTGLPDALATLAATCWNRGVIFRVFQRGFRVFQRS
jgi:hypothetical protein